MIPEFTDRGNLPKGIHLSSANNFLERFFFNEYRESLKKSFTDILDWAKEKGATKIFVGGSFITKSESPNDIDCMIVFYDETKIPHRSEMLTIESTKIDIQFAVENDKDVVDTFLHLLTHDRHETEVGIIQIDLYYTNQVWEIRHYPDDSTYEIVKRAYVGRHFIDHYEPNGLLVTIHGLLSTAKWNTEIAPIVSGQNWIFAPYIYEDNDASLLIDSKSRKTQVDNFREWLYDQFSRYQTPVSVIAHSFGTYILASYITGFEEFLPVQLNTIILTGSIINSDFDWNKHKGSKVARVRNEIAPNDQWVKHMPKVKWIDADPLYGNSGVTGFHKGCSILTESKNDIFDHNNVIRRDVLERHWLPYLMVNRHASQIEGEKYLFDKIKREQSEGQSFI